MAEPRYEKCGWLAPHDEHMHGIFHAFTCPGIPRDSEYALIVPKVKEFSRMRDEVAPAIRRTFPGVIVTTDEKVIYSTVPGVKWPGGEMVVLGLEYNTADSYCKHIALEFGLWGEEEYPEIRLATAGERQQIEEHRKVIRK